MNLPPIKVMVLGLRGFPDVQGGVEKHAEHLYPLLAKSGCQVDVITRSPYMPREHRSWRGITFHRLWAPRVTGIEALIHTILGVLYAAIKRPDVLHIHAIGPAIVTPLARFMRLRVVVTHHGPDYDREKWGNMARRLLQLGEEWGMRYANKRIVISKVINQLVKEKYSIDTVVIPNGVTFPVIPSSTSALEKFGLDKRRYVLLVSRFVQEKRHLDLINAFKEAHLKRWKLVLVGDADHPDEYSRKIKSISKQSPDIVMTGFQSGVSLSELYANAGIFVLPSSHEGLPIAMLEALSYGLPILASDIPANLEVGLPISDYFPLGDISCLARMLKKFAKEGRREELNRDNNKLISDNYNWDKIASRTLVVYQQAANVASK